ncbi:MFS transporter [Erysipelothrix larvae]|uniref:MFS transporter n=1 Tax=Erysipelothrix larvae TaxID=1514105 RepID=A0A0X8GZQ9_9FIRM|nr:MFS transporter [Erysipelothrix larvae]AMC93430.1 MFS transporter [Erysipelothrix larvae]
MKFTKEERSWILYDVANSAFILIVTATVPIFFRSLAEAQGVSSADVSALWGTATSVALLILALLSPVLGALADYQGYKKKLFVLFLTIAILGGIGFSITTEWQAFLFAFILARIGYAACNVFYDGMLVDVTPNENMDRVSSYGYAFGYIGSTIPFIIGLVLILFHDTFGLEMQFATQLSFIITMVWWVVLSLPLLKNVKQNYYVERHEKNLVKSSFKRVFKTLKTMKQQPKLFTYMIAYFFFIDGVYTIISMATTFGGEVGIDSNAMLLALLLTQFIAFPFAILASYMAKKFEVLSLLKFYIIIYSGVAVFGFFLAHEWQFWTLAIVIGTVQGGVQSLSRSYFGQLIPKSNANEYFGFFDIFGKFADFMGPLLIALSGSLLGNSRYGILMLVVLFAIGYALLTKVQKYD